MVKKLSPLHENVREWDLIVGNVVDDRLADVSGAWIGWHEWRNIQKITKKVVVLELSTKRARAIFVLSWNESSEGSPSGTEERVFDVVASTVDGPKLVDGWKEAVRWLPDLDAFRLLPHVSEFFGGQESTWFVKEFFGKGLGSCCDALTVDHGAASVLVKLLLCGMNHLLVLECSFSLLAGRRGGFLKELHQLAARVFAVLLVLSHDTVLPGLLFCLELSLHFFNGLCNDLFTFCRMASACQYVEKKKS